jgi:hypothetical protein
MFNKSGEILVKISRKTGSKTSKFGVNFEDFWRVFGVFGGRSGVAKIGQNRQKWSKSGFWRWTGLEPRGPF